MPNDGVYISVDETSEVYGHTRSWWFARIASGDLTAYERPGDRRTFLKHEEIQRLLDYRPKQRPQDTSGEQVG